MHIIRNKEEKVVEEEAVIVIILLLLLEKLECYSRKFNQFIIKGVEDSLSLSLSLFLPTLSCIPEKESTKSHQVLSSMGTNCWNYPVTMDGE